MGSLYFNNVTFGNSNTTYGDKHNMPIAAKSELVTGIPMKLSDSTITAVPTETLANLPQINAIPIAPREEPPNVERFMASVGCRSCGTCFSQRIFRVVRDGRPHIIVTRRASTFELSQESSVMCQRASRSRPMRTSCPKRTGTLSFASANVLNGCLGSGTDAARQPNGNHIAASIGKSLQMHAISVAPTGIELANRGPGRFRRMPNVPSCQVSRFRIPASSGESRRSLRNLFRRR
jgi:hypothetical protein